jgi:hypothetical protein
MWLIEGEDWLAWVLVPLVGWVCALDPLDPLDVQAEAVSAMATSADPAPNSVERDVMRSSDDRSRSWKWVEVR